MGQLFDEPYRIEIPVGVTVKIIKGARSPAFRCEEFTDAPDADHADPTLHCKKCHFYPVLKKVADLSSDNFPCVLASVIPCKHFACGGWQDHRTDRKEVFFTEVKEN